MKIPLKASANLFNFSEISATTLYMTHLPFQISTWNHFVSLEACDSNRLFCIGIQFVPKRPGPCQLRQPIARSPFQNGRVTTTVFFSLVWFKRNTEQTDDRKTITSWPCERSHSQEESTIQETNQRTFSPISSSVSRRFRRYRIRSAAPSGVLTRNPV